MAVIAAEGVNHLPKYCLAVAGVLMGAAVLVNVIKVRIATLTIQFVTLLHSDSHHETSFFAYCVRAVQQTPVDRLEASQADVV